MGYTYKPNTSNKNNFENKQNTVFIVRERERERESLGNDNKKKYK